MNRPGRSIVGLTLITALWAAIWCCCSTATAGVATQADAQAATSCCAAAATDVKPLHCQPNAPSDCPILRVRELSLAPSTEWASPVLLERIDPAIVTARSDAFDGPIQTIALRCADRGRHPPPGRPTLISLHTSLVC